MQSSEQKNVRCRRPRESGRGTLPSRSSTPDGIVGVRYSTVLLVHLALRGGGVLRLGPLGAAFVDRGRLTGRLRAIHFVAFWHNAPPRLGDRLPCSFKFVLHDGKSLLVHASKYHHWFVPTVKGNQEVLPVIDHVAGDRILDAGVETVFDHLRGNRDIGI